MPTPQEITPYENDQVSKKRQVTSMFDKIAPYYDQLNRFLSLGIDIIWRKKTIKLLKESRPESILDIATGTGDLAIEAANVIKPKHIIGVDISVNMLNIGKEKIAKKGKGGGNFYNTLPWRNSQFLTNTIVKVALNQNTLLQEAGRLLHAKPNAIVNRLSERI